MQYSFVPSEPFIFISYAHKDSFKVLPVLEELQKRNFRLWYDSGIEAGTEWPEYIAGSLNASSCVLAFISEHAQASPNCRREITYSINAGKPVMVVYLDECTLSPGMQLQLGTLHALYRNRHSTMESFMENLCRAECLQPCLASEEEEKDPNGNFEQLLTKASEGDADAQYALGMLYLKGTGVPQSEDEAVIWLSAAAKQEYAPALYRLGKCYQFALGLPESPVQAVIHYMKAAKQGYADAELAMYLCLHFGVGIARDRENAWQWCRRAAEHGNVSAQYYMGDYYWNEAYDSPNKEESKAEALRWFTLAAEQGDMQAQFAVYLHTPGDRNIKWCIAAAEQGYVEAQRRLADCYKSGTDTPINYEEAFKWFQRAAEQGDPTAQHALAMCYYQGQGVRKDPEQAAVWFAKALNSFRPDERLYLDLCSRE
jgi:TPR repeat protein